MFRFEDLEGAILVRAKLFSSSGADTSGDFVLDTGAGYLALDLELARNMGLRDISSSAGSVDVTQRPLPRLELGGLQLDQVSPVLTVDAGVIRRVTGRPVLGLVGQRVLDQRIVVVDYPSGTLVLIPDEFGSSRAPLPLRRALSERAVAVPFRLAGDGKALVHARVSVGRGSRAEALTLILDTGATKTVLFRPAIDRRLPGWRAWPSVRGLGAPTLTGDADAIMVRVPVVELEGAGGRATGHAVDAAVIQGELGGALEEAVGEPVDGLLGYSFLKHFRVAIDYPRRLLWLDPNQGDVADRVLEYCHPGLQLESVGGAIRVLAVAVGSPAARAGIRAGDFVVSLDGSPVAGDEVVRVGRMLEGPPGSSVTLGLRRGGRAWSCRLIRKRLL